MKAIGTLGEMIVYLQQMGASISDEMITQLENYYDLTLEDNLYCEDDEY